MTTYPINYNDTGFFSSDENVTDTFPFDLSDVVDWAKSKELTDDVSDIFDSKLSNVITENKNDFIDTFLKENMYLNDNFGVFVPSTDTVSSPNLPDKDKTITIDSSTFTGWSVKGRRGSQSILLGNPGQKRVVYQENCTQNHLHFPKGCSVQQVINGIESSYKCICTGTPVFNNNPHSHCSEFTSNIGDPNDAVKQSRIPYRTTHGSSTFTNGKSFTDSTDKDISVDYDNRDNLEENDTLIREAIYEYYVEVVKNIKYSNELKKNKEISYTANQSLIDSTVKYKTQYLYAFNLISGILIAGGYIYTMNKK